MSAMNDDDFLPDSPPCAPFTVAKNPGHGPPFQPRYDMGPVLAQFPPGVAITHLSRKTTIPARQLWRWMRTGVPFWAADRLATRLYRSPGELWPEWDRDEPSPEIIDWTERRQQERVAKIAAERLAMAAVAATLPPPDLDDIRSPGDFLMPRRPPPRPGPPPPRAGISDDLVHIFPEWLADAPIPPGLPPRKEEATCLCSARDAYGRPVVIGRCGDTCDRRTS